MTTIAWDGRYLAADSRSATSPADVFEDSDAESVRICLHCEAPAHTGRDNAKKIIAHAADKWRGETILAAGAAGNAENNRRLLSALHLDKDVRGFLKKLGGMNLGRGERHTQPIASALLIVTDQCVRKITWEGLQMREQKYPLDKQLAIGTGGKAALVGMKLLGLNAMDSVRCAIAVDNASGGAVTYVDTQREADKKPVVIITERESKAVVAERISKAYAKTKKPKGPSEPVEKHHKHD